MPRNIPQVDLIPLRAAVCSDRTTTLDVVIRITPPAAPKTDGQRPSLNLGFVIDRSGSMASERKIDQARDAVCYAIDHLLPSDRLSVTIFDDQVQTIISSTPVNNKASFTRLVQQIRPGGRTALHAGWVEGGIQVSQTMIAQLNRVILLSDGLANVGETNSDLIASDVHGLAQRGVSTSTMGVGNQYNEDLLEAMARSGDGNYYYIETAEQLPAIFEQELQGLSATMGRAVTLAINPKNDVVVADVLNDLDVDRQGRFKLSNLLAENVLDVVVRLKVPALSQTSEAQETVLGDFCLEWTDPERQQQQMQVSLQLPVVTSEQWEDFPLNIDVQQQAALMMSARAKKEAVRLVDQGDYAKANQVLQSTKQQMLAFDLPMSAPESAALDDLSHQLEQRQFARYRKMSSSQSYRRSSRRSSGHAELFYAYERGPRWGDISQQEIEAIVNSSDRALSSDGAISSAIHAAAGPELLAACRQLRDCEYGSAKITAGFKLSAQWVIHTVGSVWPQTPEEQEIAMATLKQCYQSCLQVAISHGIRAIAFPAIGTGSLGFPAKVAARIAFETTSQFLLNSTSIGTVRFVCFEEQTYQYYKREFGRVAGW
ncbi:MAG: VWA domain-containing protein [Cyanothece sp. SIO2G6]|nr:VWA domain-containing protein [Cyanothece sp. SIO2G6]